MKSAVWFFIGLIFGAAGGAYVASSITQKKAEDRIEKATLEARDYYKQKYEPKKEEPPKEEKVENVTRIYGRAFDLYSEPDVKQAKIEGEEHNENPNNETYAYKIDEDEFGMEDYSTYTLDYYADGNLVDETGNVVDDPVHIVGGDILDELSIDNPVAYVRNDITKTDYEVCFVDSSYEEPGGVDD